MTPENAVKRAVTTALKLRGAWYCFPATAGYGRSGVPDVLVCYRGRFLGIECKAPKGKTTALQDRELDAIEAAQGIALVVTGVDEVTRVVDALDRIDRQLKGQP